MTLGILDIKRAILGASVLMMFLIFATDVGRAQDPGIPDTLRIDSVQGLRGGRVSVAVHMSYDEKIAGVTAILKYDPQYFTLDTFLFDGGLVDSFDVHIVNINRDNGILEAVAFSLGDTILSPGSGLFGILKFSIDTATPAGVYAIDTTSIIIPGTIKQTVFSPSGGGGSILPQFVAGKISVPEFQATSDSLWVVPVVGAPGQTVSVEFQLFNETPLVEIRLPFTYSSAELQFDTISFNGTRGILAEIRQSQHNEDSLQALISLDFADSSPLAPGTGAIARAYFTISDSALNGDIVIDTVTYLGLAALQVRSSVAFGDFVFTPLFTPGAVTVDFTTDVGDDTHSLLPKVFVLNQNYPNPFNPTTTIKFSLPKSAEIRLTVYNILGQEVTRLAEGRFSAGQHTVSFDAASRAGSALASGIYFYRLEADGHALTRKMTLLK